MNAVRRDLLNCGPSSHRPLPQVKYAFHVQGPMGRGESDLRDPVVMSFFLAVPVAALLWAVLCFAVAMVAYGVRGTDLCGRVLVIVVAGVGVVIASVAAVVFKRVWRGRFKVGVKGSARVDVTG